MSVVLLKKIIRETLLKENAEQPIISLHVNKIEYDAETEYYLHCTLQLRVGGRDVSIELSPYIYGAPSYGARLGLELLSDKFGYALHEKMKDHIKNGMTEDDFSKIFYDFFIKNPDAKNKVIAATDKARDVIYADDSW